MKILPEILKLGKTIRGKIRDSGDPNLIAIEAVAGNLDNGLVVIPTRPNYIYARGKGGVPYEVLNTHGTIPLNHSIQIGNTVSDKRTLRVLKVHNVFAQKVEGYLDKHGADHSYGGKDPVAVWLGQYMLWKAEPSLTDAFTLNVYRGAFLADTGENLPASVEEVDFTSHIPGTGCIWALLELLPDGTLNIVDGVDVGFRQNLTRADIPAKTTGALQLYAVALYSSQTRITVSAMWTDLFDLRFSDTGSGGGTGGTTWGSITGLLSDQVDLQAALDAKEDEANKATDLSSNDNTHYPTTAAVKTALDSAVGELEDAITLEQEVELLKIKISKINLFLQLIFEKNPQTLITYDEAISNLLYLYDE